MAKRATRAERIGLILGGGVLLAVLSAEITFVGWLWLRVSGPW
jgi:hypothetical protein